MFDCMNTTEKYGGREITDAENHLSGKQTREVATTSSTMTVIKDLFGFIMGEEMMQYGVHTMEVQYITDKEISSSLVSNAMKIFTA